MRVSARTILVAGLTQLDAPRHTGLKCIPGDSQISRFCLILIELDFNLL